MKYKILVTALFVWTNTTNTMNLEYEQLEQLANQSFHIKSYQKQENIELIPNNPKKEKQENLLKKRSELDYSIYTNETLSETALIFQSNKQKRKAKKYCCCIAYCFHGWRK